MNENNTEKRMYCFVPYNISEIQKGIQCSHSIVEYSDSMNEIGYDYARGKKLLNNNYVNHKDWVENWKTIIILNGGTTNNNKESKFYGTLQQHRDKLKELGVEFSEFYEPDLNNALTAVAFIVDMEKDWIVLKYLQNEKLA